ncbi:MAG: sulfite exporter TauE/SafE family protein, partial [Nocardiopsaceae bacterium]|nr:sulfite exporter TauE/SafE family protein [Nocardiopsaceae bacterium]
GQRVTRWLATATHHHASETITPLLWLGTVATGIYGGYFGAAQGVMLIGLLGIFLSESLQRVNAGKNVLVTIVNGTAAVIFLIFAHLNWLIVLLIAAGSSAGGLLGAKVGRRLPPLVLRIIIVVIGVIAAVKLIFFP